MIKFRILSIGKTKEKWLEEACQEYEKRLKSLAQIEYLWAKDNHQLLEWTQKEEEVICLDPAGTLLTSEAFSAELFESLEKGGSRLALVIGGPEGLPSRLKETKKILSLSPLTFTHQLTRLILIEQIYRAFEIKKGSKYHK